MSGVDFQPMNEALNGLVDAIEKLLNRVNQLEKHVETNETKLNLVMDVIDHLAKIGREGPDNGSER